MMNNLAMAEYLMINCRPHYLPREFSSILFVAVYLPPQTDAGTKTTLNELYKAISKQENAHPEAALLVVGDVNAGKQISFTSMSHVQPENNFFNKIKLCTTFTPHTNALPHSPLGKSDHNSTLLIPAYKQKLKQEVPVTRSIRKWSEDADATGLLC